MSFSDLFSFRNIKDPELRRCISGIRSVLDKIECTEYLDTDDAEDLGFLSARLDEIDAFLYSASKEIHRKLNG